MALNIITGRTGTAHITPLQDAMWHKGLQDGDSGLFSFGNNMQAVKVNDSTVRVKDGVGSIQGRFFCIEPGSHEDVTIGSGAIGYTRYDVVYLQYNVNSNSTHSVQFGIERGNSVAEGTTPVVPTVTPGDLDAGDTVAKMPICNVLLTGLEITSVTNVAEPIISKAITSTEFENFKTRLGIS